MSGKLFQNFGLIPLCFNKEHLVYLDLSDHLTVSNLVRSEELMTSKIIKKATLKLTSTERDLFARLFLVFC